MGRKRHKGNHGAGKSAGGPRAWKLFPLYNLSIRGPCDGVDNPIWGDATLLSRETLVQGMRTAGYPDRVAEILTGGDIAKAVGHTPKIPNELLLTYTPPTLIAVRREKAEDALGYARAIRAFLTATMVLHGAVRHGFSMHPHPVHVAFAPSGSELFTGKQAGITSYQWKKQSYTVMGAEHLFKTPVLVDKAKLRASWAQGTPVDDSIHPKWHIFKESDAAQILIGSFSKKSSMRQSLSDVAVAFSGAMETVDPHQLIVSSVAAMEQTVKPDGGQSQLKKIFRCFFPGREQADRIASIINWRNGIAHESKQGSIGNLSTWAFLYAWYLWAAIARLSAMFTDRNKMAEHLDRRVVGLELADDLEVMGHASLASELRNAVSSANSPNADSVEFS